MKTLNFKWPHVIIQARNYPHGALHNLPGKGFIPKNIHIFYLGHNTLVFSSLRTLLTDDLNKHFDSTQDFFVALMCNVAAKYIHNRNTELVRTSNTVLLVHRALALTQGVPG